MNVLFLDASSEARLAKKAEGEMLEGYVCSGEPFSNPVTSKFGRGVFSQKMTRKQSHR